MLVAGRHVESHLPQNSQVTPTSMAEVLRSFTVSLVNMFLLFLQSLSWTSQRIPVARVQKAPRRQVNSRFRLLFTGRSADTLNASVFRLLMQSSFSWKSVKVSNISSAVFFCLFVFLFVALQPPPRIKSHPLVMNQPPAKQTGNKQTFLK